MKAWIALISIVVGAAVLAPGALAMRPDDRPGTIGPGLVAVQQPTASRPDDRAGIRGAGASSSVLQVGRPASAGFDWGDALIGGAGGVGIALLLTGSLFVVTSRRSRTRMA